MADYRQPTAGRYAETIEVVGSVSGAYWLAWLSLAAEVRQEVRYVARGRIGRVVQFECIFFFFVVFVFVVLCIVTHFYKCRQLRKHTSVITMTSSTC